jgi:hypothetical protein
LTNGKIYLHNYLLIMLITDLPYFGSIGFFQQVIKSEIICFDQAQPFSKMSFKNRMVIGTAQGPLHLTIPILGGRDQKTPIKDIRIAYDDPWNERHFKALLSNYQRSPFFEYYKDTLFELYQTKPTFLFDFLEAAHYWSRKQLKGDWQIFKEDVNSIGNRWYDPWLPKNYMLFPNPVVYQQVFEDKAGFLPNLSILDLLFNCGGKQGYQLMNKEQH